MDSKAKAIVFILGLVLMTPEVLGGKSPCPKPELILPCICTNRHDDLQIWCTHSDLQQVTKGIQSLGEYVTQPIDELIIENNYLPSLPGKMFQNVKILRLMLRHNGLERLSVTWLETQEMSMVELFIVENDLKSIPAESLSKLHNLQAITVQSQSLKRIPVLSNFPKLKYISIQSESLSSINEHTFDNLLQLEKLYIRGSPNLRLIKENALFNLPKLKTLEITDCGLNQIHMRAFSLLNTLTELSLSGNKITDATMVGRATRDLPTLTVLNLNNNLIGQLNEAAFVDQPMLETIHLSENNINIIHHGAFHRVPKLRVVNLNYNRINRIHPESFLQQSGSGVEELNLIGNQITHISEFRALLDTLPRLKFLDMSENLLHDIPRGALRGHPSLERLHLNKNSIKFIQADAFVAMPALRELHLSNNSLSDFIDQPFWNLPALKGLDLSNNYFQRLQPKLLFNLPALRRINLSNNQLTIIDPITFMESPLLEYVNISKNSLVSIHPATFRNLAKLYVLDASENRLIEFVPGLPRGIEQLYLQKNRISGLPIPPSPDLDLPALRCLDISSNGIQKIPPGSLKTLFNLRKLHIKRNGLRQIDETTFGDLSRLEVLDLGENQIITVSPKSFKKLAQLKQINLHGNTIESFDFVAIQENAALTALDFSKNKLKAINPNLIKRAMDVEILNISSNNLLELPSTLNMLPKLKILDASYNNIKHFDGNTINQIHTLSEFKMPYNKIIELRPASFEDLANLTTIQLENNHIEIIHPKSITNLPNLVSIYLARNHIIDIPDRVFTNLPKLKIIDLQGNRIQFVALRAFENVPLLQYLNLSNNHLTNLDSSGLRQLLSLEVLDLSYNRIMKLTKSSFANMEWLVELNLDHNLICHISGQPFDTMPRLKILSLKNNKLASVSENTFAKLRNNIAILDIDSNPLVCNCQLLWLKAWLSESTSTGPKCVDGNFVKRMPLSKNQCLNVQTVEDDIRNCMTHDSQALLPSLATSQVISTIDKIKDYQAQIKNNYHVNKVANRPLPEESEYFYDEYVDYPYNETAVEELQDINEMKNKLPRPSTGNTPVLYAEIKNKTTSTSSNVKDPETSAAPGGSFTFFGMPLPPIDVRKIFNTGRKIDWPDTKTKSNIKNTPTQEMPKFETGFEPVMPTTAGGFAPMTNPASNIMTNPTSNIPTQASHANTVVTNTHANILSTKLPPHRVTEPQTYVTLATTSAPMRNVHTNSTRKKTKTETHELEAYVDNDNSKRIAYNRTKNVEEQNADPKKVTKYNMMESNVTITQVTEKDNLLITTDTPNDMSLQGWLESSSASYSFNSPVTTKPPIQKHAEEKQPTALSAILVPNSEELVRRNHTNVRPATITKVQLPHEEHYDLHNNYSPVINREGKTRFPLNGHESNTRVRQADDKDWYYKNYNNSNMLEPFIAPDVQASGSNKISFSLYLVVSKVIIFLFLI